MRKTNQLQWLLLILGILGIVIFSGVIFPLTGSKSFGFIQSIVVKGKQSMLKPASPGLPLRIKIPKINVNARVEYVGITLQGAMDVPKGPANVAWFNLGPRPGDTGSAVIAGHEGWKNGIPAVFDNVHKLRKGDIISIEDKWGTIFTFIVREIRVYDLKEDASAVFRSSDGKAHLNLITCAGAWNKITKSYSNRLVIFTDRLE